VRCFWVIVGICLPQLLWAQVPQDGESTESDLPSSDEPAPYVPQILGNSHGYGAVLSPTTRISGFGGQPGITVGGRVGWLFHHTLLVGGEGHVLASPTVWHEDDQQVLSMTYGGFFAERIFGHSRTLHGLAHAFWGFGEAHFRSSSDLSEISEVTALMITELQVALVYAPIDWMQLQVAPGFRFTFGGELKDLRGKDYWSPYLELSLALGRF
jgi:hypothetical protein